MKVPQVYKSIGEYRHYDHCRFCFSSNMVPVLNLGNVPLAGGFLKSLDLTLSEKLYPLEIAFCKNCYLLQSTNVVNADTLFQDYFYHSSAIKTLTDHFAEIAKEIKSTVATAKPFVIEIGCNDGTLIKELLKIDIRTLGVDPAANIVKPLINKGLPIINDYFTETVADKIVKRHGKADVIISTNALAHIEDMHDVVKGIKKLLNPQGILIFEVHYLGNVLDEMQYDMIYHEHQYYYSLMTLQKLFAMYDMEIFDIKPLSIHAGSMRYYVQNKKTAKRAITKNVKKLYKDEHDKGFHKLETYQAYGKKVSLTKTNLLKLIKQLKSKNKTIAGYGASGRGTIVMNYCGLDKTYLDYVIDDAPTKQGAYTPGTHLKIVSSDILNSKQKTDYVLLFAWSFIEEIKKRQANYLSKGGIFIVPLPKVKLISR